MHRHVTLFCLLLGLAACKEEDSGEPNDPPSTDDLFGPAEPGGINEAVTGECIPLNQALDTYYTPGEDDAWPACMSDDGEFHPIDPSISAAARTEALEEIGALLFDEDQDASPDDFLEARKIYDEEEGISSRVVRRYDLHYAPEGDADCTKKEDVVKNPDYCAGPAKLQPIMQTAFQKGYEGIEPRWHAGRVQGALYWFSAISEYKETYSCSDSNIKDCDSAYGYYDAAGKGIGLGGAIREVDPDADETATLGALAVSCWREVDDALPAENITLREQARTQFDRGVLKGVVSVLLDRIDRADKASGDRQKFHWGFVTAFLGAIQSQTFRTDGADEIIASARTAATPDQIDVAALKAALNGIVDCDA